MVNLVRRRESFVGLSILLVYGAIFLQQVYIVDVNLTYVLVHSPLIFHARSLIKNMFSRKSLTQVFHIYTNNTTLLSFKQALLFFLTGNNAHCWL